MPSSADSARWKSPDEIPFRESHGIRASRLLVRRASLGRLDGETLTDVLLEVDRVVFAEPGHLFAGFLAQYMLSSHV